MKNIHLNAYLKCVESIVVYKNNNLDSVFGNIDTSTIDISLVEKYLPRIDGIGEFLEYFSILKPLNQNISKTFKQADILLSLNEPVYIRNISSANFECLIIKLYESNIKQGVIYSYENLQLIEAIISLWLINNDGVDKKSVSAPINFFDVSKNQLVKIHKLNDELSNANKYIEDLLTRLVYYLIKDVNSKNLNISLSDSTINYLIHSDLDFELLKEQFQKAFTVASELNSNNNELRIKRYFLTEIDNKAINSQNINENKIINNLTDNKPIIETKEKIKPERKPINLNKTELLLDKYESIALKLKEKNLPILGKNIAAFCSPPISPPALTDSINKHSVRISQCLLKYPNKWILLRNNYKPIKNLVRD